MSAASTDRIADALVRIDAANAERPEEVEYGRRMSAWLDRLVPEASEPLRIAVRAQHVRRWEIPRDSYPRTRAGYLAWRTSLHKFHAETAGRILGEAGFDEPTVARVGALLRKERLRTDAEAQALEDCACLVFLEHHLADFAPSHDAEKVVGIIRKTWKKMSDPARAAALALDLPPPARALVERALSGA